MTNINNDADTMLLETAQALVYFPKTKSLTEKDPVKDQSSGAAHAEWGEDDQEPQKILIDCESNGLLYSKLHLIVKLIYSGGVESGTLDENGEFVVNRDPEIRKFLRSARGYMIKAIMNLKFLGNIFPKIIFEPGKRKVSKIDAIDASWCRYELQNATSRRVENLLVNANLNDGGSITDQNTVKYPIIDIDAPEESISKGRNKLKFIYPVSYPSLGRFYYQKTSWDPIRATWLPYANLIPVVKKALLENGIMVRWIIEVPIDYWEWKFTDWHKKTTEQRETAKKAEMDLFNSFLKGEKNAGKSLMTTFRTDIHNHAEYGRWKFTALQHNFDDGVLNSDSHEASTHILSAINLDPTLAGIIPGSTKAGSGSMNRNAYNIFMAMSKIEQDLVLEPLQWALEYNGHDDIELRIKNSFIGTLDAVTPAERDIKE